MRPITRESTRDEVLAAVADHERRAAGVRRYADDEIDWRGDPPGRRTGCYWSKDGQLRINVGEPRDEDPVLARQQRAGEEDQSEAAPEWGA